MLDLNQVNLRTRLRRGSAAAHEVLDTAVSRFDLARPDGLARFLAMQAGALDAMIEARASGELVSTEILENLRDAARSDLEALGATAPRVDAPGPLRPEAVDYVILGSGLGTSVLKRDWLESRDGTVQQASRYFMLPALGSLWRAHCETMTALPGSDDDANAILADVLALFELFHSALVASGKAHVDE